MKKGVGVASETEEEVDPIEARTWLQEPNKLLNLTNSTIMEGIRRYVDAQTGGACLATAWLQQPNTWLK